MHFQTRYKFNPKTDLLGKGGFSKVYKANDTLLDRTVALKFFTGSGADNKYQILNEIKKVIRFEHPNLCKYYDVAVLDNKNVFGETERIEVGIMEYIDAGNFKTYTRKNSEYIDKLLTDVLKGLAYLHKHGIAHRDLKPQNILIKIVDDEPVSKITDFGISKLIDSDDNNSSMLLGTIEYMAPEQFNPKKYGINGRITTNLDLWSFGLLVYEALCHKSFFGSRSSGISAEQVMSNILSDASMTKADTLPAKYREIIKRCLVRNASERVKNALELIPLFEDKFVPPGKIQTNQESFSDKIDKINVQETRVIEPKSPATGEATQVINPPAQATLEVTQVIDSTAKATTDETEVIEPGAETSPGETKVVQSISGTTDETQVIDHFTNTSEVTQVIVSGQEVTADEIQVIEPVADNGTSDATDETQVIGLTGETTSEVTQVIDSSRENTTEETQAIEPVAGISIDDATYETGIIDPIAETTSEVTQVIDTISKTTTDETQVIEPASDTTTDETQTIETNYGKTGEGQIGDPFPEATTEDTQAIDPLPPDTEAITEVIVPVTERTEDQTQLINSKLAKQFLNEDTVVNKETVNKQLSSNGKELRKDNLSRRPLKRVILLSGAAILLIVLFIAYAVFNPANPAKNVASNQKTPPAGDTDLVKTEDETAETVETKTVKTDETNVNREKDPPLLNGVESVGTKRTTEPPKSDIDVLFITYENCWIKINGKDWGQIIKGKPKPIKLPVGNYKLAFESAETGKPLDSSFNVTLDMIKAGTYTYRVAFTNVAVVTGKQNAEDTVANKGLGTTTTTNSELNTGKRDSAGNESGEKKSRAAPGIELMTVDRLSANMIPAAAGNSAINFGKREVTQQEWQTIMGYNHSNNVCNECPVENVSWEEVNSFVVKINKISNKKFRLPTGEEWESVARQRIRTEVERSGPPSEKKIEDLLQRTAWYNKNSEAKIHPVGRKSALGGIYDLLGNVAEWCSDKLVKGGSFKDGKDDLKPLLRNKANASTRKNTIGFRLVMEGN